MGAVCTALLVGILLGFSVLADGLNLWPMPASASYGSSILYLSNNFQLRTEGSRYSDDSRILGDAFLKMVDVVKVAHVIDGSVPSSGVLDGLHVRIFSEDDELNFGTDETYKLSIPTSGKENYAQIEMARDILVVLISTVASEFTFSTGGRVLDGFRSSLSPKIVQALICAQDLMRAKWTSESINVEENIRDIDKVDEDLLKITNDPTFR